MSWNQIVARIKGEPVIVLTLVVPFLTMLAGLGLHLPPTAIAAVQTFVTTVAALFARSKVTTDPTTLADAERAEAAGWTAGFKFASDRAVSGR